MKYEALQLLKSTLSDQSQIFVLAGNSPWLRKQVRARLKEKYGEPIEINGEDEEELSDVGDLVCQKPLGGDPYTFIRAVDVTKNWLNKKAEKLSLPATHSILLIEHSLDTVFKTIELEKWKLSSKIHVVIANHPDDDTAKRIIYKIIDAKKPANIDIDKLTKTLFENYKHDFESIENNVEKIKLSGHASQKILDDVEPGMKDVWLSIDFWIEDKMLKAITHLRRAQHSEISAVPLHQVLCKQFRRYLLAGEGAGDYYSRILVKRAENRSKHWMICKYHELTKLNPMAVTYFDRLVQIIAMPDNSLLRENAYAYKHPANSLR